MPHLIPKPAKRKNVVIVGAGPAGLEAARVAAERGHKVIRLRGGADKAGGQMRLAARPKRRREMISIIDWRVAECERLGVDLRFNTYADASDVLGLAPDIVVIATGGLPQNDAIRVGRRPCRPRAGTFFPAT